jgi:hypothetical protein
MNRQLDDINPNDMVLVLPCVRFSGAIVSWHNKQGHHYNFTEESIIEKKMISLEEAINILHFNINLKQRPIAIQKLNYMDFGKCDFYTDKIVDNLLIGVFICKRKIGSKIGYDFVIYKGRISKTEDFQFYNMVLKLVVFVVSFIVSVRLSFNSSGIVHLGQILFGVLLFILLVTLLYNFLFLNPNSIKMSEHEKIVFFKTAASAGLNANDIIVLSRLLAMDHLRYDKFSNLIFFKISKSDYNISQLYK